MGKLGQAGDVEQVDVVAEGELPSKVREPRPAELVAARIADIVENDEPPTVEGVLQLAPGFFTLQRAHTGGVKERSVVQPRLAQ